jgi:hypothetical protein
VNWKKIVKVGWKIAKAIHKAKQEKKTPVKRVQGSTGE